MDTKQFWRLIEEAKPKSNDDCEKQCYEQAERLKKSLLLLTAEDVAAFDRIFDQYREAAYRWDLWGAAVLINGGASDDGFEYFRWWLIGQGREIFEAALAEPDSLADLIDDDIFWGDGQLECEAIAYVAAEVYEQKTGRELPYGEYKPGPSDPVGVRWKDEDLDGLYPKIAEKCESDPQENK